MKKNPGLYKFRRAAGATAEIAGDIITHPIIVGTGVGCAGLTIVFGFIIGLASHIDDENKKTRQLNDIIEHQEDGAKFSLIGDNAVFVEYNEGTRMTVDIDDRLIVMHGTKDGTPPSLQPSNESSNAMIERSRAIGCQITGQLDDIPQLDEEIRKENTRRINNAQKWGAAFKTAHCAP